MIRGTFVALAIFFAGFSTQAQAYADDPVCDPQLDSCKSSRDGFLMMCACLEHRTDLNFRGLDLRRAVFNSAHSSAPANLTGADLSGANLSGSGVLRGCRLTAADLRGANLEGADFLGVTGFRTAKLSGATFNERTTLPIESVHADEWGKPSQYRRVGCDLGMQWQGNDPITGLAETCDGVMTNLKFAEVQNPGKTAKTYEESMTAQKKVRDSVESEAVDRAISSSMSSGGAGAR